MPKNAVTNPEQTTTPEQATTIAISRNEGARQQTLRNIGLIINREYKNRVAQRAFVISTIIILVFLLIGTCLPTLIQYFASRSSNQATITIINNAGTIGTLDDTTLARYISTNLNDSGGTAKTQAHFVVSTQTADEIINLQNAVKNGKLDELLILGRTTNNSLNFTIYTNVSSTDLGGNSDLSQLRTLAQQLNVLDQSAHLGLSPSQTQSLFAQPNYTLISTQQSTNQRSAGEQVASYFLAYIGVILIFMAIFMYGMGVATGVAEEKGNRIMEILVNAATPFQLMAGKIIGIGAAGLTQMLLFVTVGILGFLAQPILKTILKIPESATISFNITGTSIVLLLVVLLYFILGFLLYSTLFAAVGALVKRQEDVQSATQPLTWLFMVGYLTSFAGTSTPNALWVKIISYIPFWTPTTMIMRIGAGDVAPWEIGMTVVLMLITTFFCAIISARIYRSGILMYGQKPTIRQLFKLARTK